MSVSSVPRRSHRKARQRIGHGDPTCRSRASVRGPSMFSLRCLLSYFVLSSLFLAIKPHAAVAEHLEVRFTQAATPSLHHQLPDRTAPTSGRKFQDSSDENLPSRLQRLENEHEALVRQI